MDNPDKVFCALDSVNAFNVCNRQIFLDEVLEYLPGMYRLVALLYSGVGFMFLGVHILRSVVGTQQGDPLGPALYSLAMRPLSIIIMKACPGLGLIVFYLDDGSIDGDSEDVAKALRLVDELGPSYGIYPNKSKTVVLCAKSLPVADRERLFSGCEVTDEGIKLLGGAIGSPEFARKMVADKIKKVLHLMDEILRLQDPHRQFTLLKFCLSGYKLGHLLRVCPSHLYSEELQEFDRELDHAISVTLGKPITTDIREVINLPSGEGGLGLPSAASIAGASYLASRTQSSKLQAEILGVDHSTYDRESTLGLLDEFSKSNRITNIDESILDTNNLQHALQFAANEGRIGALMGRMDPRERMMMEARRTKEFTPWFDLIPSVSMGQHLVQDEFRKALAFQLGIKLLWDSRTKCEACHKIMDSHASHATECLVGGGLISRHDSVRDTLAGIFRQAGYTTTIEESDVLRDGSGRRPADVYVKNYDLDKHCCIDVAVVSGTVAGGIRGKEVDKRRLNLLDCENAGVRFLPFVLNSFGMMGQAAHRVLNGLAYRYAERHLISVAQAKGRIRGIITLAMIREQSVNIARRVWIS
jgi:hypothetical protein